MEDNKDVAALPDAQKEATGTGGVSAHKKRNTASGIHDWLSPAREPRAEREETAVYLADKLESLQETACKNGFDFLFYLLDIARTEAESLHHKSAPKYRENSPDSD